MQKGGKLKRATAAEAAIQIADAQDLLGQGWQRRKITRHLRERYGLGERTARRRLAQAVELMTREAHAVDRTELAAQLMDIYQQLITDARQARQYGSALGSANALARLAGLIDQNSK